MLSRRALAMMTFRMLCCLTSLCARFGSEAWRRPVYTLACCLGRVHQSCPCGLHAFASRRLRRGDVVAGTCRSWSSADR